MRYTKMSPWEKFWLRIIEHSCQYWDLYSLFEWVHWTIEKGHRDELNLLWMELGGFISQYKPSDAHTIYILLSRLKVVIGNVLVLCDLCVPENNFVKVRILWKCTSYAASETDISVSLVPRTRSQMSKLQKKINKAELSFSIIRSITTMLLMRLTISTAI